MLTNFHNTKTFDTREFHMFTILKIVCGFL
jgi:hypothetical protein